MSTITATNRTQAVAGTPAPRSTERGSVTQFVQTRADQTLGTLGGTGTPTETRAARDTYARHGSVSHDLSSREDVGRLISRSPQLDNLSGTHGDTTRCGGASVFNAMLLDGDYQANSAAIDRLAESRHVDLSASEERALESMRGGHLTPNQSAQLQDLMYRVADTGDRSHTGEGLTGVEMSTTVGALASYGAFPNTREVNFRMTDSGGGAHHWTTTSTTDAGTAHADSWPGANGYAQVGSGPGATEFNPGGHLDPNFTADVTLTRDLGGTRLRTRALEGDDILENRFQLEPTARGLGSRRLDGDTGAVI